MITISEHYDLLIENGNDPVLDGKELQDYMDKYDGEIFLKELNANNEKSILEIGCGTGRIAAKITDIAKNYTGIDISSKTIEQAKLHFVNKPAMHFICGDFLTYDFNRNFDVIYSTLTFMHIKRKRTAIRKISALLNKNGKFVLSIDKNQSRFIDTGYSKIKIYPDNPNKLKCILNKNGFSSVSVKETELAYIISAIK